MQANATIIALGKALGGGEKTEARDPERGNGADFAAQVGFSLEG